MLYPSADDISADDISADYISANDISADDGSADDGKLTLLLFGCVGAGPAGVPDGHHQPHHRQSLLLHRAGQRLRLHLHPHRHLLLRHHHDHRGLRGHLPYLRWMMS